MKKYKLKEILLYIASALLPFIGAIIYLILRGSERKTKANIGKCALIGLAIYVVVIAVIVTIIVINIYSVKNLEIVNYDGGYVTGEEYEIYYVLFYDMLSKYGYDEEKVPKMIANKAVNDKVIYELAKESNINITEEDVQKVNAKMSEESIIAMYEKYDIDIEKLKDIYLRECIVNNYLNKIRGEINGKVDDVEKYIVEYIYTVTEQKKAKINDENIFKMLEIIRYKNVK